VSAPLISLVVPAYNEEKYLPRLLSSVDVARRTFRAGFDQVEVIVADNASTDATASVAAARGCRVVPVAKRCIAAARNGGAAAARGGVLAFVDADSQVHPETFNHVTSLLGRGDVVAGATGVTVDRWSLGIAVFYAFWAAIARVTGWDAGVVFCRRADFQAVGGYDERLRFAEDVAFLVALQRLGWRRGQRLVRTRGVKAVTSTRKFDHFGDWHLVPVLLRAPMLLLNRRAGEAFADRYWYQPPR
jgi:glycosyltransferase involved in cell wall biosynthesis